MSISHYIVEDIQRSRWITAWPQGVTVSHMLVLFVTQTSDVSDHYPIEFELLGEMNYSIWQITIHNTQYTQWCMVGLKYRYKIDCGLTLLTEVIPALT